MTEYVLTEEDCAYAAAFIDGEGSIIIARAKNKLNRSGTTFYPYVCVTNTDEGVILFLERMFSPTSKYVKTPKNCEKTKAKYGFSGNKKAWVLRWTYENAIEFIEKIYPYLRVKKRQAENLVALQGLKHNAAQMSYDDEIIMKQFDLYLANRRLNGTVLTDEQIEELRPKIREAKQTTEARRRASLRAGVNGCDIPGCEREHYGVGLCRYHWRQKNESKSVKTGVVRGLDRKCGQCSCDISNLRIDRKFCSHSCKAKWHRAKKKNQDGSAS